MSTISYAIEVTNAHGITLDYDDGAYTNSLGISFVMRNTTQLLYVTKVSTCDATNATLYYYGNSTQIYKATFSGNTANFTSQNIILNQGTEYYLLLGANGGNYNHRIRNSATVGGINITRQEMIFTRSCDSLSSPNCPATTGIAWIYNIQSITTEKAISNFSITALDEYNGSTISTFSAYVGTTWYHTTTGTITTNILSNSTTKYNITLNTTNYYSKTYYNQSVNATLNAQLYQAIACFNTTSIVSNVDLGVNNYTIGNKNSTRCFNISAGTHTVIARKTGWNTINQTITINALTNNTYTLQNMSYLNVTVYARNAVTGQYITNYQTVLTSLTYSSWSINQTGTNYTLGLINGTYTVTIRATGYVNNYTVNHTINGTTAIINASLNPIVVDLTFTETVEGYIGTADNGSYFNTSHLILTLLNYREGYIDVSFNKDDTGSYLQYYKFYNDLESYVADNIYVETPDLNQQVKTTSLGSPVNNVRVCANRLVNTSGNNSQWYITYCDYTDTNAIVTLALNDQNLYKLTGQKEGYVAASKTVYIPDANTEIISLELTPSENMTGRNLIETNYQPWVLGNETIRFTVISYKESNTITFQSTATGIPTNTTYLASALATYTILPNCTGSLTNMTNLTIFIDQEEIRNFVMKCYNYNPSITVDFNEQNTNQTQVSLYNRARQEKEYYILLVIIVLILGIIIGVITENKFNGYGMYGTAGFFFIIATTGFWEMYIPSTPVLIYGAFELIRPLIGGRTE